MKWDDFSKRIKPGEHAVFSPSQYHWLNYDQDKLRSVYRNKDAAKKGTRLHTLASECITLGERLWKCKRSLNCFVNDAIGFHMDSEVLLYYSDHFFGWTDAILYDEQEKSLRIFDLKTGSTPADMKQLEIYAALFFLEYGRRLRITPVSATIELRIYQNDDIVVETPSPDVIQAIMDIIIADEEVLKEEDALMGRIPMNLLDSIL